MFKSEGKGCTFQTARVLLLIFLEENYVIIYFLKYAHALSGSRSSFLSHFSHCCPTLVLRNLGWDWSLLVTDTSLKPTSLQNIASAYAYLHPSLSTLLHHCTADLPITRGIMADFSSRSHLTCQGSTVFTTDLINVTLRNWTCVCVCGRTF